MKGFLPMINIDELYKPAVAAERKRDVYNEF